MTFNPIAPLDQLVLGLILVLACGIFLAWRGSAKLPARLRWLVVGLRSLALVVLALLALNPGSWRQPEAATKPRWMVMLDRSASMATADVDGGSRWDAARVLARNLEKVAGDKRELEWLTFGNGVEGGRQTPALIETLKADSSGTDADRALDTALSWGGAGGRACSGVVLISDGRQTKPDSDPAAIGLQARAQNVPIFTLTLGKPREIRDISLRVMRPMTIGFVKQPVRIQGEVSARWGVPLTVEVQLLTRSGTPVATNRVNLAADGRAPVSFTLTPAQAGTESYQLRIPVREGEDNARNNEVPFEVNVLDRKIRVLLAEGLPYWDSKFLARQLRRQPIMQVSGIYRITADRFFRVDPDGAEESIADIVFPETAAGLGAYDIVVLGRGSDYFMTPRRLDALKEFVSEQGGSVVFARGKPYVNQGDGMEDLEPVEWGKAQAVECRFRPRAEGEDAGLFGGLLPGLQDGVWGRLPPVRCSHSALELKSFAQVLVEGRRIGRESEVESAIPLVVSHRYGKGMTVTVNVEGFWQWAFFPSSPEVAEMYGELWAQLLQWVGTYADFLPGHDYALHLSAGTTRPGVPVRIQVRRRGANGSPSVPPGIRVTRQGNPVQDLVLAPGNDQTSWETELGLDQAGSYRVEVVPPGNNSGRPGAAAMLVVQPPPGELDDVNPDPAFMARLAESAGGRAVTPSTLEAAMTAVEKARQTHDTQVGNAVWAPAWDRGWIALVVMLALGAEWFIRRRNGLE